MEIKFSPWKKLEVRSYMLYGTVDEFVNMITSSVPAGIPGTVTVPWADGILFRHTPLASQSEAMAREYLRGSLVWDHVDFAVMPKYVSEIRPAGKGLLTISVVDVSTHTLFGQFAKWAKGVRSRGKR